jgi:hypothetical protein
MFKLDLAKVADSGWPIESIGPLQVAVYTMCGGGHLGRLAAEKPADFYIDTRKGKLPYSRKEIMQVVAVLETLSVKHGLDPRHLPDMPGFHACGVF